MKNNFLVIFNQKSIYGNEMTATVLKIAISVALKGKCPVGSFDSRNTEILVLIAS